MLHFITAAFHWLALFFLIPNKLRSCFRPSMEYKRIHRLQTGVLSPSKLRMKLIIGSQHLRKKKNTTSTPTSPSKHQHSDDHLVNNTLLTAENEQAVGTNQLEVLSVNPSSQGSNEFACKKKQQQVRRADSASAVHPARTLADDHENHECDSNASSSSFEFPNDGRPRQLSRSFSRPASSKWNDAEKWIMSRPPNPHHQTSKKQNQLITRFPIIRVSPDPSSSATEDNNMRGTGGLNRMLETKECDFSQQQTPQVEFDLNRFAYSPTNLDSSATQSDAGPTTVRAVSMRDMGTEMTPMASQDPSRASTPMGAATPLCCSPAVSIPCTPGRDPTPKLGAMDHSDDDNKKTVSEEEELKLKIRREIIALGVQLGKKNIIAALAGAKDEHLEHCETQLNKNKVGETVSEFEYRAAAWEQLEKTKYEARFRREEVMIQVWECQKKAKLEAEMRRIEAKVEEMRFQCQTKMLQKIATARQRSEAKRAKAEARKNQHAQTGAAIAGCIRRKGHIPYTYMCCRWA